MLGRLLWWMQQLLFLMVCLYLQQELLKSISSDKLADLQVGVKHTILRHPYVKSVSQFSLHHSEENDIEVHAIIRFNRISGYAFSISQAEGVIQALSERIK